MKIIKKGVKMCDRLYKMECGDCGTVFEFKEKEGKVVYDQRDGDYIEIKCPVCKEKCAVEKKT